MMAGPPGDRGGPLAGAAPNVVTTDHHRVALKADREPDRCRVCGHRVYCDESIRAGIGRDCRRRLRTALKTACPETVAAFAIVLGSVA